MMKKASPPLNILFFGILWLLSSVSLSRSIPAPHGCFREDKAVRREWGSLNKSQRLAYINAVKCLMEKPSLFSTGVVPGAKSRFDDFVAVHINHTLSVHLDGIFLSWHRNFVWLWESALREECGYPGYQPYWNWALWCDDLKSSPLFDGSDTSLSGDGYVEQSDCPYVVSGGDSLPCGSGGGCVKDGPFEGTMVNLGPFAFTDVFTGLPANWTAYNPHCIRRDLNDYIATRYGNQTAVNIQLATTNIADFQNTMSGVTINLGVHGGGHFSIGLALLDFFASPADPAFFLHHGMVDRVWTLWQQADEQSRRYALSGTSTIFNGNATPEVTLETWQEWGVLGKAKKTGELMWPTAGDFCYEYE